MSESIKEQIIKLIKEKKPSLAANTYKTYGSILSKMFSRLAEENETLQHFLTHQTTKIIEYIQKLPSAQSRKCMLSGMIVLTGNKEYEVPMKTDIKLVNDFYKQQRVPAKREKYMVPMSDIIARHEQILQAFKQVQSDKTYQDLILSYLMSSVLPGLPVRRITDYALMKVRNYNKDTENCIDKGKFIFNVYKTASKHGREVIPIPAELKKVINAWLKINKTDYLFVTSGGSPLTVSALSKRVKTLFNGCSVDTLRSIYVTNKFKNLGSSLAALEDDASKMGNTLATQLQYYYKKPDTTKE